MIGVRTFVGSAARSSYAFAGVRTMSPKKLMTTSSDDGQNADDKKICSAHDSVDYYDGRQHEFSASRSRDILDYGHEHSSGTSSHNVNSNSSDPMAVAQGMADMPSTSRDISNDTDRFDIISHNSSTAVSLNSCMQSNVPEPFNPQGRNPTHVNMPGGGILRSQKYVYGDLHRCHPSRQFSTSYALNAFAEPATRDFDVPCPQGIQGDDCVRFKIWYENCQRFNLSNCDEQLSSLQSGRKTLAQVFNEQDSLIRQVVEGYEKELDAESEVNVQAAQDNMKIENTNKEIDAMQGLQDVPVRLHGATVQELLNSQSPCPQGIQGSDCERFRVWLQNCSRFGMGHCQEQLVYLQTGRKTLSQIFQEQDRLLQSIAHQQRRSYSTGPRRAPRGQQQPSDTSDERH